MGRLTHQIPNEDPDRLSRVMDAKYRTIGVDVSTLKTQTLERQVAEAAEAERNLQYARLAKHFDDSILLAERDAAEARARAARAELDFRAANQSPSSRREWDLNRPDALATDRPAREGDSDTRLGASSIQVFSGEDLSAGERSGDAKAQCREWWNTQARDKEAHSAEERAADMADAQHTRLCDQMQARLAVYRMLCCLLAEHINCAFPATAAVQHCCVIGDSQELNVGGCMQTAAHTQERAARRAADALAASANAELLQTRRAAAADTARREQAAVDAEMQAALDSAWLAEDPRQAASAAAGGRVRRDHWKGMTPTERTAIFEEQFRQLEELKARRRAEAEREAQWARTVAATDSAVKEQQRRADAFRDRQTAARLAFQKQQAAGKAQRDAQLKETYANKIAPEFFGQFGTSHR